VTKFIERVMAVQKASIYYERPLQPKNVEAEG
jgi:hypothetical protein